jgi:hypothetical protein
MYKPEDLSTPTKRPASGSGFIINNSKSIVLPDDQMDIDDDDDEDAIEISDEDLRGMVLPSVVQSSQKQQVNRKTKQLQQAEKDSRQQQDDTENPVGHDISGTKKRYPEKVGHFTLNRSMTAQLNLLLYLGVFAGECGRCVAGGIAAFGNGNGNLRSSRCLETEEKTVSLYTW